MRVPWGEGSGGRGLGGRGWWQGRGVAGRGRAIRESPLPEGAKGEGESGLVGGGDAPPGVRSRFDFPQGERTPRAPLDTGFRRYGGGVRADQCCWWRRGEVPALAGRAVREPPLRRS